MRPWWLRPPAEDDGQAVEPTNDIPEAPQPASAPEAETKAPDSEPEKAPESAKRSKPARRPRKRAAKKAAPVEAEEESTVEAEASDDEKEATSSDGRKRGSARKRGSKRFGDPPRLEMMEHEVVFVPPPERIRVNNEERRLALFCDLENVALGVRDSDIKKFELSLVLERLLEKGKIIVKVAYCDWERYSEFKRPFHEAAVEMIDIPQKYYSGKNSADIKMVVDAMEMCYTKEHVDTFVILSGDSDFSPLVSKLREANKKVIGVGVKNSSSALLVDNCDEFLFYEDIWRESRKGRRVAGGDKKQSEAFNLMIDAINALVREDKDVLWGSMVKQTMKRKRPSFNEGYHGYSTFSELLEDAERSKIVRLKKDTRSGSYIITGFAGGD
jgi:uncharacterized protein (TIGR00288 family)